MYDSRGSHLFVFGNQSIRSELLFNYIHIMTRSSYLTIINVDSLEGPTPVPLHKDTRLCIVNGDIANSELLIANPDAKLS